MRVHVAHCATKNEPWCRATKPGDATALPAYRHPPSVSSGRKRLSHRACAARAAA